MPRKRPKQPIEEELWAWDNPKLVALRAEQEIPPVKHDSQPKTSNYRKPTLLSFYPTNKSERKKGFVITGTQTALTTEHEDISSPLSSDSEEIIFPRCIPIRYQRSNRVWTTTHEKPYVDMIRVNATKMFLKQAKSTEAYMNGLVKSAIEKLNEHAVEIDKMEKKQERNTTAFTDNLVNSAIAKLEDWVQESPERYQYYLDHFDYSDVWTIGAPLPSPPVCDIMAELTTEELMCELTDAQEALDIRDEDNFLALCAGLV
jgi:hypothetical protein